MFTLLALILWVSGLQSRPDVSSTSIEGVVVRAGAAAGTSEVLPNAEVEIRPGNRSIVSDNTGHFAFKNLPPGQYTLTVTHAGFALLEDSRQGLTAAGLSITLDAAKT